jgi:hypothetical protein
MNVAGVFRRPEAWWTIGSNLVPVFGIIFFGWHALPLLVFYWIENVIIGVLNIPKIVLSGVTKPMPEPVIGPVLAAFFAFHYGMFCFIHGVFIFALFTLGDSMQSGVEPTRGSFDLIARVLSVVNDADLFWGVFVLASVRAAEFAILWVGGKQWLLSEPKTQMFEPYGRAIVMHLTMFIATMPVIALGQPLLVVLALALLKTALELNPWLFRPVAKPG